MEQRLPTKIDELKKMKKKIKKMLRFFLSSPTRHIKYEVINFAPINVSIMTNSLQPIWNISITD